MMQHICLNVTIRKDYRANAPFYLHTFFYQEYRANAPFLLRRIQGYAPYATVIMGRSPKILVEK